MERGTGIGLLRFQQRTTHCKAHLGVISNKRWSAAWSLRAIWRELPKNLADIEKFGISTKRIAQRHAEQCTRCTLSSHDLAMYQQQNETKR